MNYYNEFDPKAAAWLRELIRAGEIPEGQVDERSIVDVQPGDLKGYVQCHFFAGIGGWAYALKLAGWPESRPVWTASLPCQPFSGAGKQLGVEDERHLWPIFFDLVRQCAPDRIFGEQVARAIGFNWLDGISADLEGAGYAVGQAVLGAHSVGAPHQRQRLYWMGVSDRAGWQQGRVTAEAAGYGCSAEPTGSTRALDNSDQLGERPRLRMRYEDNGLGSQTGRKQPSDTSGVDSVEHSPLDRREQRRTESGRWGAESRCVVGPVANDILPRLEGQPGNGDDGDKSGWIDSDETGPASARGGVGELGNSESFHEQRNPLSGTYGEGKPTRGSGGAWDSFDILPCLDGKARRVESGTFPLAYGVPGHVGLLRGYGNAIVPQVAAQFIGAYLDIERSEVA